MFSNYQTGIVQILVF